jgi:predicted nuclease with TOPRIM domain
MLTAQDLDEIEKVVDEKIDEKTRNLPTKDEFFGKMDEVMGELKAIREEQPLQSHRLSNHEDRISVIEKKLQINPNLA